MNMNLNGTFQLDASHSSVAFVARHAMVTKVRGTFNEVEATIVLDGENSKVQGTAQAASIDTGNSDRDEHVRGDDFFAVEQHPTISFESTSVELNGEKGKVHGNLEIKGNSKPVTFDVEVNGIAEDPFGNTRLGFEASTKINRKDFGIDFNAPLNTGGMLVSEEIKIEIDGSAIKQD
nr:YceI family protein [Corynebacterium pseudopelargi]